MKFYTVQKLFKQTNKQKHTNKNSSSEWALLFQGSLSKLDMREIKTEIEQSSILHQFHVGNTSNALHCPLKNNPSQNEDISLSNKNSVRPKSLLENIKKNSLLFPL